MKSQVKEQATEVTHKDGPAWKNSGRFNTWDKADQKRHALIKEWKEKKQDHMQIKVKRRAGGFVVKARVDPTASKPTPSRQKKNKKRNTKKNG